MLPVTSSTSSVNCLVDAGGGNTQSAVKDVVGAEVSDVGHCSASCTCELEGVTSCHGEGTICVDHRVGDGIGVSDDEGVSTAAASQGVSTASGGDGVGTFAAVDGGSTGAISDGVVAFVTVDGDASGAVGDGVVLGTTANGRASADAVSSVDGVLALLTVGEGVSASNGQGEGVVLRTTDEAGTCANVGDSERVLALTTWAVTVPPLVRVNVSHRHHRKD